MNAMKKVLLTVGLATLIAHAATGQHFESLQLQPFEGTTNFSFGDRVAISGPWALVGDRASTVPLKGGGGEVDIYLREPTGWRFTQIIRAGGNSASFGGALAIDGTTAVVGAPTWDFFATRTGKAFVFELIDGQWVQTQALKPKGLKFKDFFGGAVGISGDVLAVGAKGRQGFPGLGEVFIYERSGSRWTLVASFQHERKLEAAKYGGLGHSVAVWRNRVVAGAASPEGVAYVYEKDEQGWHEVAFLKNPNPTPGGLFAGSAAIWGDTVVVGDPEDESDFGHSDGSAFVFERTPSGDWPLVQELTASDGFGGGDFGDHFGDSVSIHWDRIAVGARAAKQDDIKLRGKLYLFERQLSGQWLETDILESTSQLKEGLGWSVAINGGFVVAGATSLSPGAAYMFEVELGTRYCFPDPNSTGEPARLTVTGTVTASEQTLILSVRDCPSDRPGLFLLSSGRETQLIRNGNGWLELCLGPEIRRLSPTARTGPAGVAIHTLDFNDRAIGGSLLSGTTWYFQFAYRHGPPLGAGFNLSNAVALTLE